ncbi:PREDICTED: glycine-rich protein [Dufourea novaeangliae]|uniref:glycine-rich protein n=1 Tax=Dufourea novaeangliae TaxID=178035 RepID=UPI000767B927|nr:PREDICTED: glycine-rich protein [Dufourea novaeangliae]
MACLKLYTVLLLAVIVGIVAAKPGYLGGYGYGGFGYPYGGYGYKYPFYGYGHGYGHGYGGYGHYGYGHGFGHYGYL